MAIVDELEQLAVPPAAGDPMLPRRFVVRQRRRETPDTSTFTLAAVDGPPMDFAAGQFTMIGLPGAGEAPISISGDPRRPDRLLHTIRDVGGLTHPLCNTGPGDLVTVRGPFGRGWEAEDGAGGDVIIVAGGIGLAPLRPAVLGILAERERFHRVVLAYGTRTPDDLLFEADLREWRARFDVEVAVTVDRAAGEWQGRVGLVTALLDGASFDPGSTLALVCGPEIMMRFTAAALVEDGVPANRIRVSMERHMQCGVGLCGHCQLREYFVCTDGPVLSYDRLAPLLPVREL